MKLSSLFFSSIVLLAGALPACAPGSAPGDEPVGSARGAVFVNGGFETGTVGNPPPSWTVSTFLNNGITLQTPQTRAGLNLAAGGKPLTNIISGTNQADPDLGNGASLRYCRYGTKCVVVNFHSSTDFNNGKNVNALSQDMTIGAGDVDASDGQVHIRFTAAPVLQNPVHPSAQQPYYLIQVTNITANTLLYTDFNLSAQAGVPWKTVNPGAMDEIDYVDWSLVDIAPGASKIAVGDTVRLEIIAAGCSPGGHFGEVYVDGVGTGTVPGLFVTGVGPAQANAGTLVTYNMTYKNGSAGAETGVVITFTTPPNTTFQSLVPPANAVCVTPAVGAAGTITCTVAGTVAAGATGTFQVGVNLSGAATGTLVCGNYDIKSAQETTLLGSKITTVIGCSDDAACGAAQWCNVSGNLCTPTLPNGTSVPSDAGHSNPALNGACTVAAGTLVCQSAVCDTSDNKCGRINGNGPCTVANQGTVCRSSVCDASDNKCGYATNDGPCTIANGPAVCRSGTCSANGLCRLPTGCNVDADCTGGQWCIEATHACTAKLSNGTVLPTDAPHTNPILNGACTVAAATLVCQASVCDTGDSKCGYDTNSGPCTAQTGPTVCRSGSCSTNGKCQPLNGCNVDADCTGGKWCAEATHACTAKLSNGTGIPVDAPHSNPFLDGKCSAAAGTLVCQATVCDTIDNKCGKLNGSGTCTITNQATICRSAVCDTDGACGYDTNHGPCTTLNAATVCRSGACSANGLCQPAGGCNVDGDCSNGQWCNETNHACSVKLTNGTAMPTDAPHTNPALNGVCSAAAATLVCQGAVCDTDNKCGYDVNSGPCSAGNAATVCRSGSCSTNGKCQPLNGCNVDADCTGGNWCNESLHACTPKLANSTPVPSDAAHTNPTLNGTCSALAGALVCQSAVCDVADSKCGYAVGDGPCTLANGSTVCRSGACSSNGVCRPAAGCNVDADCAAGNWCQEGSHTCLAQLANATPIPTDAPHTNPTLDGKCSGAAATLVCQSAVCDAADDRCGYAVGHGPCTAANGATVCRSGSCSSNGLCQVADGCNVDADCAAGNWCNEAMNACLPKLDNGVIIPTDAPHTSPTLDGTCSDDAAALVCSSGVCASKDNECGYPSGVGPCTAADGPTVCRSTLCSTKGATKGTCVDCAKDADCPTASPVCNAATGSCVECLTSAECSGKTPICDTDHTTCVACDGDQGSTAVHPCASTDAPLCFTSGAQSGSCGTCASNDDCSGHAGNVCDKTSGACVAGCTSDSDCSSIQWCNDTTGMCTHKLENGTPLPTDPERVATCSSIVGSAVCVSEVCDPADNSCGLAPGDGPCDDSEQCRTGTCDANSQKCVGPSSGCMSDADCSTSEYCASGGVCAPLLPTGRACAGSNQCLSHDCNKHVCNEIVGQGAGVACAVQAPGSSSGGLGAGLLGLALSAAAVARRRRGNAKKGNGALGALNG